MDETGSHHLQKVKIKNRSLVPKTESKTNQTGKRSTLLCRPRRPILNWTLKSLVILSFYRPETWQHSVTLVGDSDCKIKYDCKDAQNTKRGVSKVNKGLMLGVNWHAHHLFCIERISRRCKGVVTAQWALPWPKWVKWGLLCEDIETRLNVCWTHCKTC